MAIQQDLAAKVALVTGATRGIGRAIAFQLASRGASILGTCSSPSSLKHIDSLWSEINEFHKQSGSEAPKVLGIVANVLSLDAPLLIANALEECFSGKVHIVINNAAYDEMRPMGQLDNTYVHNCLLGNYHALVMTVEALYKRSIIQPNSRIVNVSAIAHRATLPFPGMMLLAASKAAMEALTRSWADLFRTHPSTAGTTVNSLVVGATATEALLHNAPAHLQQQAMQVLQLSEPRLGTMGHVNDVAHVAGLLVREDAGWINGSAVCANGGSHKIL